MTRAFVPFSLQGITCAMKKLNMPTFPEVTRLIRSRHQLAG